MTERNQTSPDRPANAGGNVQPPRAGFGYKLLWVVCLVVGVTDFFYHKHITYQIEEFPAFYGLLAFLGAVALMFVARGVREVVRRREDYYDRQ